MTSVVPGMAAEVTMREFPKRKFAAQVASIAGALDPATRTLLIEVHMANSDNLLRPGMYAEVNFHLRRTEPPLIIPASALILRSGAPRVATVASDNKVRFQNVQLGRDYGTTVEIVDGLNPHRSVGHRPRRRLAGERSSARSQRTCRHPSTSESRGAMK